MKPKVFVSLSVWGRAALVAGLGWGCISCSLPPRQAWQRMKEEGILKGFFVPQRLIPDDRTQRLAGADLSVEEVPRGATTVVPVAERSEHPGYVYSPRTSERKLVNVNDFAPGEVVLCPYTMETFRMPGGVVEVAATVGQTWEPEAPLPPPAPETGATVVAENPAVEELKVEGSTDTVAAPTLFPSSSTAPFGSWVEGKPGLVYSPFAARHQLVDVTGIGVGAEVQCPFSGRVFRVPEAAATIDPTTMVASIPESPDLDAIQVAATEPPAPGAGSPTTPEPTLAPREPTVPAPSTGSPKYGAPRPPTVPPWTAPKTKGEADQPPSVSPDPPTPPVAPPPTATWVPSKPGLVQSPFSKPGEWVDVTGKPSGSKVVCPYTNKQFLVPQP